MVNIYDFFDDVVCINLDISVDRKEHSQMFFDKFNIPARFYTAKKHPNGGMYGCFESHIEILKDAFARNLNNILVFEDDFLPTESYSEEKLQTAIDFMKSNEDWDILHLGYSTLKDDIYGVSTIFHSTYYSDDIVQYNACCAQALCYSKRAIKAILDNYQDFIGRVHYDMFLSCYMGFTNYCVLPMLFDQNFYLPHNNESNDAIEFFLRALFPLLAFTKINYRASLLKYICNKYDCDLVHYLHLFLFSLVVYKIKIALLHSVKKNVCNLYKSNGTAWY